MSGVVLRLLLIAVCWCLLNGSLSVGQFLIGLLMAVLVLVLSRPVTGVQRVPVRLLSLCGLVIVVLWDLCLSSLRVARDVLLPGNRCSVRILAVPVPDMDVVPLTVLANTVTLTPGSLSLDVSDDGRQIFVHDMYAGDREAALASVNGSLMQRVRSAFPDREAAS